MNESLLIELVKSHEELYNTNCSGYRSEKTRKAAWIEISEQCGATPQECKEAWTNLRNRFSHAKQRRLKINKDLGRWKFGEEMSFLIPYIKPRLTDNPDIEFVEASWKNPGSVSDRFTVVLLIDLVRRYELLYNPECKDYTNARERYAAWSEIADLHGSSVNECKQTWLSLRNCYTNSIRRRERSKKSKKWLPWRFEKEMSFLKSFLRRPDGTENIETPYDEDISNLDSPENSVANKRKASAEDLQVSDGEDNTSKRTFSNQELDDVDHFFLTMSKMTKKLPKTDQIRIKLDLHKLISEAELKHLQKVGKGHKIYIIDENVEMKSQKQDHDYTYEVLDEFTAEDDVEYSNISKKSR